MHSLSKILRSCHHFWKLFKEKIHLCQNSRFSRSKNDSQQPTVSNGKIPWSSPSFKRSRFKKLLLGQSEQEGVRGSCSSSASQVTTVSLTEVGTCLTRMGVTESERPIKNQWICSKRSWIRSLAIRLFKIIWRASRFGKSLEMINQSHELVYSLRTSRRMLHNAMIWILSNWVSAFYNILFLTHFII